MQHAYRISTGGLLLLALLGCGSSDPGSGPAPELAPLSEPQGAAPATTGSPVETPPPAEAARSPAQGSATVSLTGEGVDVAGEFAASQCAGMYILGKGVAYQTNADGWTITVATEERRAGDIALTRADGDNQVIATASGPGGQHFVRKPALGGTFRISDDFSQADADLELGNLMGRETVRLQVTFECA